MSSSPPYRNDFFCFMLHFMMFDVGQPTINETIWAACCTEKHNWDRWNHWKHPLKYKQTTSKVLSTYPSKYPNNSNLQKFPASQSPLSKNGLSVVLQGTEASVPRLSLPNPIFAQQKIYHDLIHTIQQNDAPVSLLWATPRRYLWRKLQLPFGSEMKETLNKHHRYLHSSRNQATK